MRDGEGEGRKRQWQCGMGWGERRDSKRSGYDKYGVGGRGQEKKMELGGELGREGDRDEGCIRLQDSSEQC